MKTTRAIAFSTLFLVVVTGFGCSAVVNNKLKGKPGQDAGSDLCSTQYCPPGAVDGTDCSTATMVGYICVNHCCTKRRCGDGYVDTAAGEQCEPPGTAGCGADCKFACTQDSDCNDGDPCNGVEACNTATHACYRQPGNLPAPGSPCQLMLSDGGIFVGTCQNNACSP